jgi:outer membrane protein TolC
VTTAASESEIGEWQIRLQRAERQLQDLTSNEEVAIVALKVATRTLDSSKKRAVQGEVLCQETEEDLVKLEVQIKDAGKEVAALERQQGVVREQIEVMVNDGGLSSRPKPTMHPPSPLNDDVVSQIQIRPYGYCKQ